MQNSALSPAHQRQAKQLFARLNPPRNRPLILFPRLCWHYVRNYKRDKKVLTAKIYSVIEQYEGSMDPELLSTYIDSIILLHYVQHCDVQVYSMLKPELMESLVGETARVIRDEVPGAFVDVGVWKGGSSMIIKSVIELLGAERELCCLDVFDTMDDKVLVDDDPDGDQAIIAVLNLAREFFGTEGVSTSVEEVRRNFQHMGVPLEQVRFLKGNLVDPAFPFEQVPDTIALLRIDCDFYTATQRTMESLYDRIPVGGSIILDDYYLEAFGERIAVDEFRAARGITTPLAQVGQSAVWVKEQRRAAPRASSGRTRS